MWFPTMAFAYYSFFSASAGSAFALLQYWKPATAIVSVILYFAVTESHHLYGSI